jgi:pimeloyl-ACP methyl ester carboxylesterase
MKVAGRVGNNYGGIPPKMRHLDASAPMGGSARLSDDASSDTAIVFVHGFKGHHLKTWGKLPEMASYDKSDFWRKADLYFLGYKPEKLHVSNSAHRLSKYISSIFPSPPASMFECPLDRHDWTLSLVPRLPVARIRPGPYMYSKLYLVGHSLGGLIIRRFIADQLEMLALNQATQGSSVVRLTTVRLFAPAHLGFEPSGWTGAAFKVSQEFLIGRILEGSMYRYRAYAHLHPRSRTITELRRITETLGRKFPSVEAVSAHLLWGEEEQVVANEPRYECDLAANEQYEPQKAHRDICKPTGVYRLPLDFIERGVFHV